MPNLSNAVAEDVQKEKKKRRRATSARVKGFSELYTETGESLGEGSFGHVRTYVHNETRKEYAVKVVEMIGRNTRIKVLKEIEIFYHCQGHENILQLIEYFEEGSWFYLVFEKMDGGSLLETIEKRGNLTEQEASFVIRDIAMALSHLHKKGIAHRDLKPENILCVTAGQLTPAKLCDFDLGSGIQINSRHPSPITTPELQSPVGSAEFMAPEVLDVWHDQAWSYDKRCDLWSLGIILYILLCGYPPFFGSCDKSCGWQNGESCLACQEKLFNSIQEGFFGFPEKEWSAVSQSAKDLIQHLLVRDPHLRYSAEEVLRHPWVTMESPQAQLATPRILLRNNSVRDLGIFTETANAVNRLLLSHLSISEVCAPPSRVHIDIDDLDYSALMDPCDAVFQLDLSSDESDSGFPSFGRQKQCKDKHHYLKKEDVSVSTNYGSQRLRRQKESTDSFDESFSTSYGSQRLRQKESTDSFNETVATAIHCRLRETQMSGDSGFASGDMLASLAQTPPRSSSTTY